MILNTSGECKIGTRSTIPDIGVNTRDRYKNVISVGFALAAYFVTIPDGAAAGVVRRIEPTRLSRWRLGASGVGARARCRGVSQPPWPLLFSGPKC